MKHITTEQAPAAIGPYSQAVEASGFLFVSGQLGLDPANGELASSEITGQTEQTIKNLENILKAAGSSLDRVVKTTVYLARLEDFPAMNGVYSRYFTGKPARATVVVSALPRQALVEIECVALTREG
ncbi:MAG TPA: RidA family protein [bacterium]|nr:RidA family protein [bacterium]HOL67790.1 RidA family protein [bacterium]HPP12777.1 RidA family protein [bacterium]